MLKSHVEPYLSVCATWFVVQPNATMFCCTAWLYFSQLVTFYLTPVSPYAFDLLSGVTLPPYERMA